MAKLPRITSNQFAESAGIAQIGVFGSFAEGSPTFTTNAATAQSLSNWLEGWFAAIEGSSNPAIEDMNAMGFVLSYLISYIYQAGVAEWDSGTTYYMGSLAQDGGGNLYVSIADGNINHPLSNPTYWSLPGNTSRTLTASTTLLTTDNVVLSNSTAGNLTMTLPAISSTPSGKKITMKDIGTGGFATTVTGSGSDMIDGAQPYGSPLLGFDSLTVFNNGSAWYVL